MDDEHATVGRTVDDILSTLVRDIPDWPQPGVLFRDITPLLDDADALRTVVSELAKRGTQIAGGPIDRVIGIEARGFILAAPVAMALGAGFVPVRKAGKLPAATHQVNYALEYGTETLEIHQDALASGDRVLVIDDVLATGGTVAATAKLIEHSGAVFGGAAVLLELTALGGRDRLADTPLTALRTID